MDINALPIHILYDVVAISNAFVMQKPSQNIFVKPRIGKRSPGCLGRVRIECLLQDALLEKIKYQIFFWVALVDSPDLYLVFGVDGDAYLSDLS